MFKDIKAFLSSFMRKARTQRLFRKYLGITLIGILAFLIPATLIFCYMQFKEAPPAVASPEISITIFDNDGHTLSSEKTNVDNIENTPFVKSLYTILNTKSAVEKPVNFKKNPTFNLTLATASETSTFKCYFEKDYATSFLEDANGNFFTPNENDYIAFLSASYSQPVYPEATPPTLSIGDSTVIIPREVDWSYTLINDSVQKSDGNDTTEDTLSYMIDGIVKFKFSLNPDECNIKITDKTGIPVFEGSHEDISKFSANEGDEFNVSVYAKWNSDENSLAYGEQTYAFDIICTKPSEIKASSTEASEGSVIILSISNVNSAESVVFTPQEPLIPDNATDKERKALTSLYEFTPLFTLNEQNAYALIPIPQNIPASTFEFSVAYGIAKADFTISLTKHPVSATISVPKDEISLDITSAKDDFKNTVTTNYNEFESILLFTSEFLSPEEYGFTKSIEYNSEITIDENTSFKFLANSYVASNSETVAIKSANIGIVKATGYSDLLGNYVVIDHGAGLYTWYCGLSDIGISTGTVLKKGEFIGRSGSTSPLCSNGVNIFCTLFGNTIDPSDIIGQKLI